MRNIFYFYKAVLLLYVSVFGELLYTFLLLQIFFNGFVFVWEREWERKTCLNSTDSKKTTSRVLFNNIFDSFFYCQTKEHNMTVLQCISFGIILLQGLGLKRLTNFNLCKYIHNKGNPWHLHLHPG